MREKDKHQRKSCGRRLVQPEHRVCGHTRKERLRPRPVKDGGGEAARRADTQKSEARERNRMVRKSRGPEEFFDEVVGGGNRPLHQPQVRTAIGPQAVRRRLYRTLHDRGRSVVEGMRKLELGKGEFEAEPIELEISQGRRRKCQWMDRRAHVVNKSRQGQLGRARPTPDRVGALKNEDGGARPRQRDRGGEAVGARADNYGVVFASGAIQTPSLAYSTP